MALHHVPVAAGVGVGGQSLEHKGGRRVAQRACSGLGLGLELGLGLGLGMGLADRRRCTSVR